MLIIKGITGLIKACNFYITADKLIFPPLKHNKHSKTLINEFRIKYYDSFRTFLLNNYGPSPTADRYICQRWAVQIVRATL